MNDTDSTTPKVPEFRARGPRPRAGVITDVVESSAEVLEAWGSNFEQMYCELDMFFDGGPNKDPCDDTYGHEWPRGVFTRDRFGTTYFDSPPVQYDGFEKSLSAFQDEDMPEAALRDVIFSDILNIQRNRTMQVIQENFGFMEESINQSVNDDGSGNYNYNESELPTIFTDVRNRLSWIDNNDIEINRTLLEEDLLVTTATKPDMVILRHQIPSAHTNHHQSDPQQSKRQRSQPNHQDQFSDLIMGEFKHSPIYSIENAWVQCAHYLLTNLYWQRVQEGVPITYVYGFFLCGPKCLGHTNHDKQKFYTVGFIKLNVPTKLDSGFPAGLWSQTYPIDEPAGLNMLVHFFLHGKRADIATFDPSSRVPVTDRVPSMLICPIRYWIDTDPTKVKLVRHGGKAIVFQVKLEYLQNLVGTLVHEDYVRKRIGAEVAKLVQDGIGDDSERMYYIKFCTKSTQTRFSATAFVNLHYDIQLQGTDAPDYFVHEFMATYPCTPYGGSDIGITIMNDRGENVSCQQEPFQDVPHFKRAVTKLKQFVDRLSQKFNHGDLLWHNVTIDVPVEGQDKSDRDLHLIDLDEGTKAFYSAIEKVNYYANAGCQNWATAMLYPNALVHIQSYYIQVQFAALFQQLATSILPQINGEDKARYLAIVEKAKVVGHALYLWDTEREQFHDQIVEDDITDLNVLIEHFLGVEAIHNAIHE